MEYYVVGGSFTFICSKCGILKKFEGIQPKHKTATITCKCGNCARINLTVRCQFRIDTEIIAVVGDSEVYIINMSARGYQIASGVEKFTLGQEVDISWLCPGKNQIPIHDTCKIVNVSQSIYGLKSIIDLPHSQNKAKGFFLMP